MLTRPPLRDTPEWRRGDWFQRRVAEEFRRYGYHVVPSYDFSGANGEKAPMAEGPFSGLRLPDMQVFKPSDPFAWVEVKYKQQPDWTHSREPQGPTHGFGLLCYQDYLQIERLSGVPVYILIGERCSGEFLLGKLTRLHVRKEPDAAGMDRGGMVFFPRSDLKLWGTFDPDTGQMQLPFARPFLPPKGPHSELRST